MALPLNLEEFGVTDSVSVEVVCDGADATTVNDLDVDWLLVGTCMIDGHCTSIGDEAGVSSGRRIA